MPSLTQVAFVLGFTGILAFGVPGATRNLQIALGAHLLLIVAVFAEVGDARNAMAKAGQIYFGSIFALLGLGLVFLTLSKATTSTLPSSPKDSKKD